MENNTVSIIIKPRQTLIRSHSLQPNNINDVNDVVFTGRQIFV